MARKASGRRDGALVYIVSRVDLLGALLGPGTEGEKVLRAGAGDERP